MRSAQIRFAVFEVDLRAGELRRKGLKVKLQEQPFQVLAMLIEHMGEVVTREELHKKLWPADTTVDFDHGLNKAINKIRTALGDSAENPRFVETVARRGYRFLAEVSVVDGAPLDKSEPAIEDSRATIEQYRVDFEEKPAARKRLPWRVARKTSAFALGLVVVILVGWMLRLRSRPSLEIRSLAVLPLESLSSDASQEYFADGMTDELITDLGQISALRVISRTSVMPYKRARKPLPQVARELNVSELRSVRAPSCAAFPGARVAAAVAVAAPIVAAPEILPVPPRVPALTWTEPVPVAEPLLFVTSSVPFVMVVPPV